MARKPNARTYSTDIMKGEWKPGARKLKVSPEAHKIGLSYRAAIKQAERKEIQEYRSTKSSPTATIGDAVMAKRNAG